MANPQRENGYTAIANEIMEALAKIRISGEARQMLDVIIRKTYGFNKKVDSITTSQFMQMTGLPNFAIHKARKKLLDMNLITITKKGNSQILTYSFQKDYHKWKVLPKKVTVTKKGNGYNQKRLQTVTKKAIHKRKKDNIQKKVSLSDEDFINSLKANPAYSHIDINRELAKMDAWLLVHKGRQKTRRFIVNWLNKIDKPLTQAKIKQPDLKCPKCNGSGWVYDEKGVFRGKCSCKE